MDPCFWRSCVYCVDVNCVCQTAFVWILNFLYLEKKVPLKVLFLPWFPFLQSLLIEHRSVSDLFISFFAGSLINITFRKKEFVLFPALRISMTVYESAKSHCKLTLTSIQNVILRKLMGLASALCRINVTAIDGSLRFQIQLNGRFHALAVGLH